MREILFRGKRKDNGEWVCGYLWVGNDSVYITPNTVGVTYYEKEQRIMAFAYEVNPSTVCQYTGLTDKNGKKIFEGDIVKIGLGQYEVWWNYDNCSFTLSSSRESRGLYLHHNETIEVIGNIYDNPELIGE